MTRDLSSPIPADAPAQKALRALGAEPVPATIPADLRALLEMPEAARAAFGEVLGPCLEARLPDDVDRLIEAFARKHDAVGKHVALGVRGARFAIWEAAKARASIEDLSHDLGVLVGEAAGASVARLLTPIYETAARRVRAELARRALADHGTVVVGVDWRLDRIVASQHASSIEADVGVLTFSCREGSESRRVTLQLDKEMLVRLRSACDRLLG
jgi:hypothetical protein